VFISDFNSTNGGIVRKVDASGTITALAGAFGYPLISLATDPSGNVYAADSNECVIWKITPTGATSIVAGVQYNFGFNGDGIPATQAQLAIYSGGGWRWIHKGFCTSPTGPTIACVGLTRTELSTQWRAKAELAITAVMVALRLKLERATRRSWPLTRKGICISKTGFASGS